mmetsp:Transcript_19582/g.60535  ORF Transcript_19582/g.60535 Transcript_19582/m.60535 type:complete len:347 (-) Transcript_19582:897-1937(-)
MSVEPRHGSLLVRGPRGAPRLLRHLGPAHPRLRDRHWPRTAQRRRRQGRRQPQPQPVRGRQTLGHALRERLLRRVFHLDDALPAPAASSEKAHPSFALGHQREAPHEPPDLLRLLRQSPPPRHAAAPPTKTGSPAAHGPRPVAPSLGDDRQQQQRRHPERYRGARAPTPRLRLALGVVLFYFGPACRRSLPLVRLLLKLTPLDDDARPPCSKGACLLCRPLRRRPVAFVPRSSRIVVVVVVVVAERSHRTRGAHTVVLSQQQREVGLGRAAPRGEGRVCEEGRAGPVVGLGREADFGVGVREVQFPETALLLEIQRAYPGVGECALAQQRGLATSRECAGAAVDVL